MIQPPTCRHPICQRATGSCCRSSSYLSPPRQTKLDHDSLSQNKTSATTTKRVERQTMTQSAGGDLDRMDLDGHRALIGRADRLGCITETRVPTRDQILPKGFSKS